MTSETTAPAGSKWRTGLAAVGRLATSKIAAFILFVLAICCAILTYLAFTGLPPFDASPGAVFILLNVDLVVVLALGGTIAINLVQIWSARRRGAAGSRLHSRLVARFGMLAIAPTVVVAIFSMLLVTFGMQSWFSDRVSTAVSTSLAVAEAYLHEHQQLIRADVVAMATDLNRAASLAAEDPQRFGEFVVAQGRMRSLPESIVFDTDGNVLSTVDLTARSDLDPENLPPRILAQADEGGVVVLTTENEDRVRALIKLVALQNAYLYVGRAVDPQVVRHIEQTRQAVNEYQYIEGRMSDVQITFAIIFVVLALLLLFTAVLLGLAFATKLVRPISALIGAAERVRSGDLSARVADHGDDDELGSLSRAFNRMTDQLSMQRNELVAANELIDRRRRFTEAVLSGVTAGVVGLDRSGAIHLANKAAEEILGLTANDLRGARLAEAVPEMADVLSKAKRRRGRVVETHLQLERKGGPRSLVIRVATEMMGTEVVGFVVTIDDITELGAAQRKAAWADVARRIAHEIKNPLTPIQLSAERLKRKYLRQIEDDPQTFALCTDTIVRQVDDLRRMVDEFSSFARMPTPTMKKVDVRTVCIQSVVLQRTAHPGVTFDYEPPASPLHAVCDPQLIGQAVTNLLQNAINAIEMRTGAAAEVPGRVEISTRIEGETMVIDVADNGCGLPSQNRERLTEPYVTTREKGTGLGLAIVKRIMEDHQGTVALSDRPGGGAHVRLTLATAAAAPAAGDTEPARDVARNTTPGPAPDPANDGQAEDTSDVAVST